MGKFSGIGVAPLLDGAGERSGSVMSFAAAGVLLLTTPAVNLDEMRAYKICLDLWRRDFVV